MALAMGSCQSTPPNPNLTGTGLLTRDGDIEAAGQVDIVGQGINSVIVTGASDGTGHGVIPESTLPNPNLTGTDLLTRDGDIEAAGQVDIVEQGINSMIFAGASNGTGHGVIPKSTPPNLNLMGTDLLTRDGGIEAAGQVDIVEQQIDPVISAGAHKGDGHGAIHLRP